MIYEYQRKFVVLMSNFGELEEFFDNKYEYQRKLFNQILSLLKTKNVEKLNNSFQELINILREQIMILQDFRVDLNDSSKCEISKLIDEANDETRIQELYDVFLIIPHNISLKAEKILANCVSELTNFKENINENSINDSKKLQKEFISILRKYSYKNQKDLDVEITLLYKKIDILIFKLRNQSNNETKSIILDLLFSITLTRGLIYLISLITTPKVIWFSNLISSYWTLGIFSELKNNRDFKKYLKFLEEYFENEE